MRDWLLVLLPLALVLYFMVLPDHFHLVIGWLDSLVFSIEFCTLMSRYKGQLKASQTEREFPHHVDIVVPPSGLGTRLDAMYDFHTASSVDGTIIHLFVNTPKFVHSNA